MSDFWKEPVFMAAAGETARAIEAACQKIRRLAAEEMRERAISAVQEYLDACRDAHSHINYVEAAQQILALLSALPTEE